MLLQKSESLQEKRVTQVRGEKTGWAERRERQRSDEHECCSIKSCVTGVHTVLESSLASPWKPAGLSLERGPHPLQAAFRPLESQFVRKLSLPFFSHVLIFSLRPKVFFYFTSPKIFFMSLGTHHPLSTWGNGGASIDPPLPRPACKALYAKSAGAAPTRTHITRTWCSYRPPVASVAFLTNTAVENVFPFMGNKCETRWKCFLLSNMDSAYSLRTYLNITLSSSPLQANFQLDYCVVMIKDTRIQSYRKLQVPQLCCLPATGTAGETTPSLLLKPVTKVLISTVTDQPNDINGYKWEEIGD